jgi:tRNA (guanine37-N1)-methyltransferase
MSLRERLGEIFEPWELKHVGQSYDIIGDIAVIRIPETLEHKALEIAEAVMQDNAYVKTVLRQTGPVTGEFRLRRLGWLMGEKKTETTHKESGCLFKVDLEKCYFSPRLSFERMRVAKQVKAGEVVVNMFAGVGCFSILIAKYAKPLKVYSVDVNPDAIRYMDENIRLNKARYIIEAVEGDAKEIITRKLLNVADRVLMPLPEKALEYLDYALMALKPTGGMIHYYDFVHAGRGKDPIEEVKRKVSAKLRDANVFFEYTFGRIVRTVGPRWFQVVLDINVHEKINRTSSSFIDSGNSLQGVGN